MSYRDFTPARTLPQLLIDRADSHPDEVAVRRFVDGTIRELTWVEQRDAVARIALGLAAHGVGRGDRVAIMSDPRPAWLQVALAAQSLGAIPLGVYATNSPSEVKRLLEHSGAVAFVGESSDHLEKGAAAAAELSGLRLLVGIDERPPEAEGGSALTLAELRESGGDDLDRFRELVEQTSLDDVAVLFYTSGTTGVPKGVTHSHRTFLHASASVWGLYPTLDRVRHDAVGFLPLAHVAPAVVLLAAPLVTKLVVTFCRLEEYERVMREVRPTAILWPPRFHEKHAAQLVRLAEVAGPLRRLTYRLAMRVGRRVAPYRWERRRPPLPLRLAYAAAVRLVFVPLRARIGLDRIEVSWTASAAMPPNVMALWQIWGLDLRETYGLTETAGSTSGHYELPFPRPGDIGSVFPDPRWEVRLEEDGEMLIRAPELFLGYWQNEEETREVLRDGWLRTGDLAEWTPERHIRLIGRKKDVIVTSGGKSLSPQPVEVLLKESPLVTEAVLVGDGRKYLTALLDIDRAALGEGATEEELRARLWADVERANADLARVEQIKDFRVLPRPLTIDGGDRTPNGKLRRDAVHRNFAELIDEMYAEDEARVIAGEVGALDAPRG
jgi:long-chain acyl-CoA synthetase